MRLWRFFLLILISLTGPLGARAEDLKPAVLAQFKAVHPVTTWSYDWTTAIFLYGAAGAGVSKSELRRDFDTVMKVKPVEITSPDLSAMSLPAVLLLDGASTFEQSSLNQSIQASKTFFASEPLNEGGVFDHVGHNSQLKPWLPPTSWVVPSSVWADSSVMYALNGLLIALHDRDAKRASFFIDQLRLIHRWLWDSRAELYKHAYYFGSKSFAPAQGFWARGNLWMTVALMETALHLPIKTSERAEFEGLFRRHVASLRRRVDLQRGLRTILDFDPTNDPFETSASALFAYALMKGARMGLLAATDGVDGRTLASSVVRQDLKRIAPGRISVDGISCPTTAMKWPWYYTRWVGVCPDESYGVGAVLLMLSEM